MITSQINSKMGIYGAVVDVVTSVLGIEDRGRVMLSSSLGPDLGAESYDFYGILAGLNERFGFGGEGLPPRLVKEDVFPSLATLSWEGGNRGSYSYVEPVTLN